MSVPGWAPRRRAERRPEGPAAIGTVRPVSGYWEEHPLAPAIEEVARGSFKRREPPEIEGSGYVVRSLEAALWAFHRTGDFRSGCLAAVNLGDDADTTGAVFGQLAGAVYGASNMPPEWLEKLALTETILHFADALLDLAGGSRRRGRGVMTRGIHTIGAEGERLLADHLARQGRCVERSDSRTFDLIVDGQYAEVKSTTRPYSALGFIGLTQNQYDALEAGVRFSLYLVCNTADPAHLEIIEISSEALRDQEPTVEATYYFYRRQLDAAKGR